MDEALTQVPELVFQFDNVLKTAAIAGLSILILLTVMLAFVPLRFPLNPLYLIGSAVTINTAPAYLTGFALFMLGTVAYGSVIAAAQIGFEVRSFYWAWGAVTGAFLYVVSGTTLAYGRTLHGGIRAGQIGDPGPFLIRYGSYSIAQLACVHLLFGAVFGEVYPKFN